MGNKPNKQRSRSESDVVANGLDSQDQGLGGRGSKARRSESAKDQKKKNKKATGGPKGSSSIDDLTSSSARDSKAKSLPADSRQGGYMTSNGGAMRNGGAPENNQLEVKIYRSYSNLADMKHATGPGFVPEPLDMSTVKVYRRSTASSSTLQPSNRTASLPRGFGRSRSCAAPPNSNTMGPELRQNAPAYRDEIHSATLPYNRDSRVSTIRHSTGSTLSYQSTTAGYRVTKEDFPNATTARKKLKQFEKCFISSFVDRFSSLPSVTQLTSLAVALWPEDFQYMTPDGQHGAPATRAISLFEYMKGEQGLPANIHEDPRFIMLVPPALFPGIAHVREMRGHAPIDANLLDDWSSLSRDVLMCVVAEAAMELSRIFEYQVSLLASEMSIQLVADHCAERCIGYLIPDPLNPFIACLDRNTLVHGAVRGTQGRRGVQRTLSTPSSPVEMGYPPKYISVIIGMKELKWNVYEIFSKPALRRDVMLVRDDVPSLDEDDRSPWTYHVAPAGPRGPGSDHMLYGYRGQIIDWDYADGVYRLNNTDEKRFSEESEWRYDDFHRTYVPLRQVIGARAMMKYCVDQARLSGMGGDRPVTKLDQYVREKVEGSDYTRDSIQVVYRPLERFIIPSGSGSVNLTGVEMPPRTILPPPSASPNYNNNNNSNDVAAGNQGNRYYGDSRDQTDVNDTLERPRHGKSRTSYTSPTQGHTLSPPQKNGPSTSTYPSSGYVSDRVSTGYQGDRGDMGYAGDRFSSGDVFEDNDSRPESIENSSIERPRYTIRSDI